MCNDFIESDRRLVYRDYRDILGTLLPNQELSVLYGGAHSQL